MIEELSSGTLAAIAGLIGGCALGVAARWARFCTLGAIEDAMLGGNPLRLRMWLLAIAIAMFGVNMLALFGIVNPADSFYLISPTSLMANAFGGLLFGLGMALVGTCGFGTLARLGGGDLKSLVTFFVMGVSGYATLRGLTAYGRMALFPSEPPLNEPFGIAHSFGALMNVSAYGVAIAIAIVLAVLAVWRSDLLSNRRYLAGAGLVAGAVVWGFFATGWLIADEFDPIPLESYTFTAPLGETLIYVMTATGATLKFGVGSTVGVVFGAAVMSKINKHFRWEACDDPVEMKRQIGGGFLMGVGGVTALGCTIGQGMSAAALLAYSAPVALAGIFLGAWLGLQYLVADLPLWRLPKKSKSIN